MLLLLYLEPSIHSLRRSLEWITEIFNINNEILHITKESLQKIAKTVFLLIINKIQNQDSSEIRKGSIDFYMNIAYSYTCIANIDKDIHCLNDSYNTEHLIEVHQAFEHGMGDSILLNLLESLLRIIDMCITFINPNNNLPNENKNNNNNPDTNNSSYELISAEVIKYAECCGEVIKIPICLFIQIYFFN